MYLFQLKVNVRNFEINKFKKSRFKIIVSSCLNIKSIAIRIYIAEIKCMENED